MSTTTVNISFQKNLLREIDRVAKAESRSRSELLREAARAYIVRKQRWSDLTAMGQELAEEKNLTAGDVAREIRVYRARTRDQR
jgi:CopG family transcriptional regulator / antitoxin EndoAI